MSAAPHSRYRYQRIVSAKRYLDAHFPEPLDLKRIAAKACFSPYHFLRLFKSCYRITPHQYLMQVRIRQARLLLEGGADPGAACLAVGFESLSSFSGLFKKVTGSPPSVYRRQAGQRAAAIEVQPLRFVPNCYAETYGWTKTAISENQD